MSFFIYSSFEKGIFLFFSVVLHFSYSTVISNILMPTAKYDTYKVISFMNDNRKVSRPVTKREKVGICFFFQFNKNIFFLSLFINS